MRALRSGIALSACLFACSSNDAPVSGSGGATTGAGGATVASVNASSASGPSSASAGGSLPALGGLGPPQFAAGDLDAPSDGGTITFQQIGATGWFPSIRNPATGPCDAYQSGTCCLAKETIATDDLTPWDQDLIMTLRGPMLIKQFATYQPSVNDASTWQQVSAWDDESAKSAQGIAFEGDASPKAPFAGAVGSECLVNASTDLPFGCGAASVPYCAQGSSNLDLGWSGSKLFVLLATMPHASAPKAATQCSANNTGNWYDAPWLGLSVGELVRAGSFSSCQCYAKDPTKGYLGDGCGQFNVFEVVNDNDSSKNLDVFSTNMIGYAGYVGQGPCGMQCNVSALGPAADLIDKATSKEALTGAVATPAGGPTAAFRRPESGYRYFMILLDVASRTVQLAIVHPQKIPASIAGLLPSLPGAIPQSTVGAVLDMRLPK